MIYPFHVNLKKKTKTQTQQQQKTKTKKPNQTHKTPQNHTTH